MLVPAIIYKDELERKFKNEIYTERYFYYVGYAYGFELPEIEIRDNYYQWAIIDEDEYEKKILGYLAYHICPDIDSVNNFGWYSFEDGNQTVIRDTYNKLEELVKQHHRLEWRVIAGNHAKKGYDRFCMQHGGNIVCLHDITKDLHGNYRDEYIYEIISSGVRRRFLMSLTSTERRNKE